MNAEVEFEIRKTVYTVVIRCTRNQAWNMSNFLLPAQRWWHCFP